MTDEERQQQIMEYRFKRLGPILDKAFQRKEAKRLAQKMAVQTRVDMLHDKAVKIMGKLKEMREFNRKKSEQETIFPLINRLQAERSRLEEWMPRDIIKFRCMLGKYNPYSPTLLAYQAKEILSIMAELNAHIDTEFEKLVPRCVLSEYKKPFVEKDGIVDFRELAEEVKGDNNDE